MSEIQARWFAELIKGQLSLPDKAAMNENIKEELVRTCINLRMGLFKNQAGGDSSYLKVIEETVQIYLLLC